MKLWNNYYVPKTTDEAIGLLSQHGGQARVIAGGTDLLVDMRASDHEPHQALVDITRIPELRTIGEQDGNIYIGAGVTHTQIVQSLLLSHRATCLVESCGVVGGPQVRNVGTLGGNVAHALPAGDGTTSLVALDASAEISQNGTPRWVSILEMFLGPGKSLIDPTHDLLLRFRFLPTEKGEATAFKRIMRPQGVALPILGCAVWVRLDESRTNFEAVRICIAPAGPRPMRAVEVELALEGKIASIETVQNSIPLAQKTLKPRTSKYRATADYRREMIDVLLRRTLMLAVERARTGHVVPEGVGL